MLSNVKYFIVRSAIPAKRICGPACTNSGFNRFSTSSHLRNEFLSEKVESRSLVKLSGADVPNFLQGLLTNDIRLIESSPKDMAMYCMLLNTQGRILNDLLVYRINKFFENDSSLVLECDSSAADDLVKTLSKYKLRKKAVSFSKLENYSVWSVFPKSRTSSPPTSSSPPPTSSSSPSSTNEELRPIQSEKILTHSIDPRIPDFGHRLLLPSEVKGSEVISNCTDTTDEYLKRRFDFGLSEGLNELLAGQSFPLECNLFFLNGVSFSKGCYVGQELTTRTHHTGVIRKRIMPIFSRDQIQLSKVQGEGLVIVCESTGKECGKVKNWSDTKGLALLRLQEALLSPGPLLMKNSSGLVLGRVETFVPHWWPSDVDEVIKKVRSKQEKMT